jgi:hypothetical protein
MVGLLLHLHRLQLHLLQLHLVQVHLHQVQVQGTGCMISKDALRKCKNRKAT